MFRKISKEMIETVIELDRIEMSRIPREHFFSRKFGRIKGTEPVFVMPTRRADVNLAPHDGATLNHEGKVRKGLSCR